MKKISQAQVKSKRVLIRADLNCPIKDGKIQGSARIAAHAKTIRNLSERGARVIVLAHQGRKGSEDYTTLEQHAKILHDLVGKPVHYVDDLIGNKAKNAIESMKDGEIIVLENVRSLDCETDHPEAQGKLVENLSKITDIFVLDALSIAHRKQSSVVGFTHHIPSYFGDVLADEVEALEKVKDQKEVTFIFGGSKVEDSFSVMKKWLSEGRAKKILVGGALSVLLLHAKGKNVGDSKEYLKNSNLLGFVDEAKKILEAYGEKIVLPVDVGLSHKMIRANCHVDKIHSGEIYDIGEESVKEYIKHIQEAKCIIINGPMGVYELEDFAYGSKNVLKAVADCDAFSLVGGGHTITAIEKFAIDKKYYSYVSLSGKALIEFICGKELPAIVALKKNEEKFHKN